VFQSLKDSLRGQTYESDKDLVHAVDNWFEQLDEQFFMYGIKGLAHRWEKCVTLRGDYNCKAILFVVHCFYVFLITY